MALAGHPVVISAKVISGAVVAGDEIDGINSVDYSPTLDMLDVTDFKDTTGAKLKIGGLKDGSAKLGGDLEMSDLPQGLIRTAAGDGTSLWLTFSFNPGGAANSKGFQVECKISGFQITGSVDGKITFSCDATFTGAPAVY